jgi:hypothetical protein
MMMAWPLYVCLGVAALCALVFFWCTYRHVHEPEDGRQDGNVVFARRISVELAREMQAQVSRE